MVTQNETITILPGTPGVGPSVEAQNDNPQPQTQNSQKRLRLYASLSMELFERHLGLNPAHDVYQEVLGQSSQAFIKAYDNAATEVYSSAEVRERLSPVMQKVRQLIWNWKPFLHLMEVPTLPQASSALTNPVELTIHASQLLDYLTDERIEASPLKPRQVAVFVNALTPILDELRRLASERMERSVERRNELALAREEAYRFERVLVAYRQTLRQLLSSKHPDVRAISRRKRGGASKELIESDVAEVTEVTEVTEPLEVDGEQQEDGREVA